MHEGSAYTHCALLIFFLAFGISSGGGDAERTELSSSEEECSEEEDSEEDSTITGGIMYVRL